MTEVGSRTQRRDRAVLRGAFATGATRLLMAASSYVTLAIAVRILTKDEFGLVAVLVSFWLILTMFDMGIGGALIARVGRSYARDDLAEIRVHFYHALLVMSVIGGLIAVVGAASAVFLPWDRWIGWRAFRINCRNKRCVDVCRIRRDVAGRRGHAHTVRNAEVYRG